jgi:hypothetical protein
MDQLYMQKTDPALRTYLTKLREQAYIEIRPSSSCSDIRKLMSSRIGSTAKEERKRSFFFSSTTGAYRQCIHGPDSHRRTRGVGLRIDEGSYFW